MKKSLLYLFTLLCIACTSNDQSNLKSTFLNDSLVLKKKYELAYDLSLSKVRLTHTETDKINDSLLKALNHELFSSYLLRSAKYDSAYFYLYKAGIFLKNDKERLFYNSMQKIYLLNRIGLLKQSEIEIDRVKKRESSFNSKKNLFVTIFSLPNLKERDSIKFKLELLKLQNLSNSESEIIKSTPILENYKDNLLYAFYESQKDYISIEKQSQIKIHQLLNYERTKEDLFFTNLFFCIKAKDHLQSSDINFYFSLYDHHKASGLTRETEILLYNLKANYYQKRKMVDSTNYYLNKGLEIANATKNNVFRRNLLKKLMLTSTSENKFYARNFINTNDSLISYKSSIDDYIFTLNSGSMDLLLQQNKLKNIIRHSLFFSSLIISLIIIYFLVVRNNQTASLIRRKNVYLDIKSKMYNYLLEIKEKIDLNNLKQSERIQEIIYNDAIKEIEVVIKMLEVKNVNLDLIETKLIEIEKKVREISYQISSDKNKSLDLSILLDDLKQKFCVYFKIECFHEKDITINEIGFTKMLRAILFSHLLFNKLIYKENITVFVSVYKQNNDVLFKIWINNPVVLNIDLITFLEDRFVKFKTAVDQESLTVYIIK